MERTRIKPQRRIIREPQSDKFVSSGSVLFDQVLGGGWARSRVVNIVGDRSSGKTQLAIEAAANFALITDAENIRYGEAEAAFDQEFGEFMGMPRGVQFTKEDQLHTVEDWYEDMSSFISAQRKKQVPCLYILDSLDALSDAAELERAIDDDSYGTKAKKISELFRRLNADLTSVDCTLFVISQIRDAIGVRFGEKKKRSGGKALDFYASQIVWLAELTKITRTVMGVKRPTGIEVLARTKKNKVGMPFREAKLTLTFGYGIDDEISMLNWLESCKAMSKSECDALHKELLAARKERDRDAIREIHRILADATRTHWQQIEDALKPAISKYS